MLNKRTIRNLFWLVILLSPLIAGIIISYVTATDIYDYDAWNTTWNDEVGYYRTTQLIRAFGKPQGVAGYNEVASKHLTYGPYNYFTYFPYILTSLLTGTESHNFIVIGNLLFILAADIYVVWLLKPDIRRSIFIALFFSTAFVMQRYTWSGMCEAVYICETIIIVSSAVWLYDNNDKNSGKYKVILVFACMVCFWAGLRRPYMLAFLLILLPAVFKKGGRNTIMSGLIIAGTIGVCLLYFYLNSNYCAPYFANTTHATEYLYLISAGKLREIIIDIAEKNNDARIVLGWYCTYEGKYFIRAVVIECIINSLILLCIFLTDNSSTNRRLALLYVAVIIIMYEAVVLLYTVEQIHRILLAVTVGGGLIIALKADTKAFITRIIIIIVLLVFQLQIDSDYLKFPQENDEDYSRIEEEYSCLSDNSTDPWDNTILVLPDNSDLSYLYGLPSHITINWCTVDYLSNSIEKDLLKSRYIFLSRSNELNKLCDKYDLLLSEEKFLIYRVR